MGKNKTEEKTQNSRKKLKTQAKNSWSGRHSPLTCPQVMLNKKSLGYIRSDYILNFNNFNILKRCT